MFYVGLDPGQRQDHCAIAVVEKRVPRPAFLPPEGRELLVRQVERLPLGTPYAGVVARVRELVCGPALDDELDPREA